MSLNNLAKAVHQYAKDKGFYDTNLNIIEALCRIHGEVSELAEVYYKNPTAMSNHEGLNLTAEEEEFADIILRTLDLCHYRGIDIDKAIALKMEYNKTRPYKHGKNL